MIHPHRKDNRRVRIWKKIKTDNRENNIIECIKIKTEKITSFQTQYNIQAYDQVKVLNFDRNPEI
jgi:hypothetical protein